MKIFTTLFLLVILLFACTSPQKLIEKGDYMNALKKSQKRLKKGKIKTKDFKVFQQSFQTITDQDAQTIQLLRMKGKSNVWPAIYRKAIEIEDRQAETRLVVNRLKENEMDPEVLFYPAKEVKEEARQKSALYFYACALEYMTPARNGDRIAAREAYDFLAKCLEYVPTFKDAEAIQEEMFDLGVTHVLIRTLAGDLKEDHADQLFEGALRNINFPLLNDWQMVHIKTPDDYPLHYQIEWTLDKPWVSFDDESKETCTNTKEVEDGFKEEQVWSDRDSAYVTERTTLYKTIEVTIETFTQTKNASIQLLQEIINLSTNTIIDSEKFTSYSNWENVYSKTSGDMMALSSCHNFGGGCDFYPSYHSMLRSAACNLQGRIKKELKSSVEYFDETVDSGVNEKY